MKTQDVNIPNETLPEPVSINAKKPKENIKFRSINSLNNISREEWKKVASKPLYLARYE